MKTILNRFIFKLYKEYILYNYEYIYDFEINTNIEKIFYYLIISYE